MNTILTNPYIEIIYTSQLLKELSIVTERPKIKKILSSIEIQELINIIQIVGSDVPISSNIEICRDKKDNFLLSLIQDSGANYLVSGDNDLLVCHPFKTADIISFSEFEKIVLNNKFVQIFS